MRCAAVFLGLLVVVACEVVLRIAGFEYIPRSMNFTFIGPELEMADLARDPVLFWRIRPGSPEIAVAAEIAGRNNREGFRGPVVNTRRPPGAIRIACLGDSCTYGVAVPLEHSYPVRLQRRLEHATGRAVEVMNTGCPGYSSHQGLRMLETRVLPFAPDVVSIYFGNWNDFVPAIGGDDESNGRRATGAAGSRLAARACSELRIAMLIARVVDHFGAASGVPPVAELRERYIEAFKRGEPPEGRRVPLATFRNNLESMVRLCRDHGITPVLITPPLSAEARLQFPVYREYLAVVEDVAARRSVAAAPAAADLARRETAGEDVFLDWVHPNAAGYEIIADLLLPEVVSAVAGTE